MTSLSPASQIKAVELENHCIGLTIVKSEQFNHLTVASSIVSDGERTASQIIENANREAKDIISNAEANALGIRDSCYKEAVEKATLDSVEQIAEIATMASALISEIEADVVEIVIAGINEIVSGFKDEELVKHVVSKALVQMGSDLKIDLWVSPEIYDLHESGVIDLLGHSVVNVRRDIDLVGSNCRLDNGKIVLVGNSSTQVELIRVALKSTSTLQFCRPQNL